MSVESRASSQSWGVEALAPDILLSLHSRLNLMGFKPLLSTQTPHTAYANALHPDVKMMHALMKSVNHIDSKKMMICHTSY